jgi:hypothetical protein
LIEELLLSGIGDRLTQVVSPHNHSLLEGG